MITLDGSYGEGGGQIIRTALALSALTQIPFQISRIRSNRTPQGLQPQHLTACQAMATVCKGRLKKAEFLSEKFSFEPGTIEGGDYVFDIGTAGSTILVAQTLIPPLLFAKKESRLLITGGTHLIKSPNYDYFEEVFLKAINRLGAQVAAKLIRPGYYPKGGGEIEVTVFPSLLKGNQKWQVQEMPHARIRLSRLPSHIAERERNVCLEHGIDRIEIVEDPALSPGNAITIWQGFKGASGLGELGKRAERVAEEAFIDFQQETEEVDLHLADQLLLYAALAEGTTCYQTSHLSEHLKTNAYVVNQFLPRTIKIENRSIIVT